MTPEEYKKEWLEGKHDSEYNNCRFSEDKIKFCIEWLSSNIPGLNLENPQNIVDIVCRQKIRIAKDTKYRGICTEWSDKIKVDDKLREMGMPEIIIPKLYAKYGSVVERDLQELPDKNLILKCNHGSGWNIKFIKSKDMNWKYIISKLNEWLTLNYAYITGYEAQYENITPGIIIEELLTNIPVDYGFWCVDGKILGISLTKKLAKNIEEYIAFVDENGRQLNWCIGMKPAQNNLQMNQKNILSKIIPYVNKIAKQFDFVRVDMYYVNGHVYFGETTFTPCSGRLEYTTL